MTKSGTALDMTTEALISSLNAIATPAEVEMINHYLGLGLDHQSDDKAQGNARKRTARYKFRTALRREPSSQHILQACAYVVFSSKDEGTLPLVKETLELLVLAGFDQNQAVKAMDRFVHGARARKVSWVARTKSRLWLTISRAIKELASDENVTR